MDTKAIDDYEREILIPGVRLAERMAPLFAKVTKIHFDALRKEGFTERDAIQIVCSLDLAKRGIDT